MIDATIGTLSNGIRVANFSSPHPFNFIDGTVIERCDAARVAGLALDTDKSVETPSPCGRWQDVRIVWDMPQAVEEALDVLQEDPDVDIVLVPLPVMTAIKAVRERPDGGLLWSKARVVRVASRETKAIHIDKFCV